MIKGIVCRPRPGVIALLAIVTASFLAIPAGPLLAETGMGTLDDYMNQGRPGVGPGYGPNGYGQHGYGQYGYGSPPFGAQPDPFASNGWGYGGSPFGAPYERYPSVASEALMAAIIIGGMMALGHYANQFHAPHANRFVNRPRLNRRRFPKAAPYLR